MDTLRQGIGWLLVGLLVMLLGFALAKGGVGLGILLGLIGLGLFLRGLVMVLWFLLRPAKTPDA